MKTQLNFSLFLFFAVAALSACGGEIEVEPAPPQPVNLTSDSGREIFPVYSPDGTSLAYASRAEGNWDIYLKRGGGAAVNLTADSSEDDWQADFSPDGTTLAFRSERDDGGIFLMDTSGGGDRKLIDSGFNPVWSPDGREILYATEQVVTGPYGRAGTSYLWAVNVEDGERRQVSQTDAVQGRWSPNGGRIAYWALPDEGGGQRDIYTIAADGTGRVQVTQDADTDWSPAWSPDGRYLYFGSDRDGAMNLWRVRIDEESGEVLGSAEQVTTGTSGIRGHISFSSDGQHVAYIDFIQSSTIQKAAFDSSAGIVSGEPTAITEPPLIPAQVAVSPDGEWVGYFSTGRQEDLFVIRPDGADRRQLTNDVSKDRGMRWSPDGTRISFYSDRTGNYEIWTMNPDGTGLEQVTDTPNHSRIANRWSPDGSRISYRDLTAQGESAFVVEVGGAASEQTPEKLADIGDSTEFFVGNSWSPDGGRIAGGKLSTELTGSQGIYAYDFQSRSYEQLLETGGGPIFLKDGRRLLYRTLEPSTLYLLDSQTGSSHEALSVAPNNLGAVAISSDNQTLFYILTRLESDVLEVTVN